MGRKEERREGEQRKRKEREGESRIEQRRGSRRGEGEDRGVEQRTEFATGLFCLSSLTYVYSSRLAGPTGG